MNIVLFGPQGSGKGTQAQLLAKHFDCRVFSTGDVLREFARTHHDPEIEQLLSMGKLIPDGFIFRLMEDYFKKHRADGIVFDGFPRDMRQYNDFNFLLKKYTGAEPFAGYITLPEKISLERIKNRRICTNCKRVATITAPTSNKELETLCKRCGGTLVVRHDDTEQSIQKRLDIFRRQTLPVIDHYRARNRLVSVDGTPSIDEVTQSLLTAINAFLKKKQ